MTDDRLQRALVTAAYVVTRHGPQYAPIFDRLEREMEMRRKQQDPLSRARRVLEAHTIEAIGTHR